MEQNKNRDYNKIDENKIKKISLSLVTEEDVLDWSNGEVTKPETINYKSYKPERYGLFDELIFGPTTDFKCPICGKKYKKSNEGQLCKATANCEIEKPEILPKIARRTRMGHIDLNVPVVHFWFFKIDHSIISKLLGLKIGDSTDMVSKADLESVIYYKSHIVLESGGLKNLPKNKIININNAAEIYKNALLEVKELTKDDPDAQEIIDESLEDIFTMTESKQTSDYGVDFYELNEVIEEYSNAKIDTGSRAIEYLLSNINLEAEREEVKNKIKEINTTEIDGNYISTSKDGERKALYKRLKIINSFIDSGQHPTSMLIYKLPVIPVDLRPLVQLDGGRHSTSDINELYRRIIIRNNRLKKWLEAKAPTLIVQNELRMIQEAVDALIDNAKKKPKPIASKDNRPLKSLADALTGKKGRFRQNLLGKRVDYSGRSVIVVGPNLKMHQAGIPREMAAKLFEPWIIKRLIEKEISSSVKQARKLIENLNPIIWPEVAEVIKGRPVLLNRAPTLHRLSIQAFEPVLIRGRAIRLHPLVTAAFNADFDGDQMAVHVPISPQAVREAKELLYANRNILGPKDGEPIINPSQDMVLGIYYLTMEVAGAKGEGKVFNNIDELIRAHEVGVVDLHARVAMPFNNLYKSATTITDKGYVVSTVGKFIFNQAFPDSFPFIFDNTVETYTKPRYYLRYQVPSGENILEHIKQLPINNALTKKNIARIIRNVYDKYVSVISKEELANVIDQLNSQNIKDVYSLLESIRTINGTNLNHDHSSLLAKFTTTNFWEINKKLSRKIGIENPLWEIDQFVELLENTWFDYVNVIASFLDEIKSLGFKYSTISGTSIAISDISTVENKNAKIAEGEEYTDKLKEKYRQGWITDDERYSLTIQRWAKIKENIQDDLKEITSDKSNRFNPIFIMMNSGARATISNFVQLAGLRGLMANNVQRLKADAENERVVRSTVEIPVKSSFLEGLTSYEFYSSTHGARKGLTDTALNTAKSGYLTRRLIDVAQSIVVREKDCGSDVGFEISNIVDNKTNSVIVDLLERIEGRFTLRALNNKFGNEIIGPGQLITKEIAEEIVRHHDSVEIRSILACGTQNGVCQMCFGKDLSTSRIVSIGEAVGITASQSIGEPGTQLTMRTFHTGGVAGVEDITGGFGRLSELIDAYKKPWGKPAVIAKQHGKVKSISERTNENGGFKDYEIEIEYRDEHGNVEIDKIHSTAKNTMRVVQGDFIVPGQKIIDGPIILVDLLKYAGIRSVQSYLLKEIQRIYRMQGIAISDKYIEIIVSQMLSKIQITHPGDSPLVAGSQIDRIKFQKISGKLLSERKQPPFGKVMIEGAKRIPLLSESFLSAASYQESAKIIVNAAISSRVDKLTGLKENIILGHKIPAGTNSKYTKNSKFDIKDPYDYFPHRQKTRANIVVDKEIVGMIESHGEELVF
ncbi:DNA-directed RNA polymerase subunit beta' [Mycoplasma testudineum]|uniref:DNA-directed RNA polymerase subunit beta' n=1 Tax=Mycoplasma testudineum TaxID=244584 RepID=A0A4R6IFY4_9MOLU|nr:DNA-directed RNA polymerase subunit beta' [Mycoplasma testudineum]OYD27019.1 DNA-directed RNA polymerase subunit beta' [Mycoplasma testudineum]TDO20567.1 DNA-directed RNA polymerase subunit beta' [Mycoplasma testudineum]